MLGLLAILVRYYPFWAIPVAIIFFEIGMYHYNRRALIPAAGGFGLTVLLVISTIFWLAFEGYWRAWPFLRNYI